MMKTQSILDREPTEPRLYSLEDAAQRLGGISVWTLRAHIQRGTFPVVRVGRRVLLASETVERIVREGLPSLS